MKILLKKPFEEFKIINIEDFKKHLIKLYDIISCDKLSIILIKIKNKEFCILRNFIKDYNEPNFILDNEVIFGTAVIIYNENFTCKSITKDISEIFIKRLEGYIC